MFINNNAGANGEKPVPITQVEKIVGKQVTFYNVDLLDYNSLSNVFDKVSTNIKYTCSFNLKSIFIFKNKRCNYIYNNIMSYRFFH